jgi:hypothetical protein
MNEMLKFKVEGATSMKQTEINPGNLIIEDLKDREISIKVTFDNPAIISMSDQSVPDRMVIDLAIPLIGQNGLEMLTDGFEKKDDGSLQT